MSTSLFVSIFLAIGALAALGMFFALRQGIDHRDCLEEDGQEAMKEIEHHAGTIPGGIATALVVVGLFWPAALAIAIRNRLKG